MKYYYSLNNKINGPVEKEFLKGIITRETYIWMHGLKNWERASEIPDLLSIFEDAPPPLPTEVVNNYLHVDELGGLRDEKPTVFPGNEVKIAKEIKSNLILLIVSLIISFFAAIFYYEHSTESYKSLQTELSRYSNIPHGNILNSMTEIERFDNLIEISRSLSCYPYEPYYGLSIVPKILELIEVKLSYIFDESRDFGFYTFLTTLITLILGKYLIKSIKWVSDRSS